MSDKAIRKCGQTWEYCNGECVKCPKRAIKYCTSTQDAEIKIEQYRNNCIGLKEYGCEASCCDDCFYSELKAKEQKERK